MKHNSIFFNIVFVLTLISASLLFAETQSVKLLTNAHCNGCKSKIEKALKKVDGVQSASLDLASKIVEVSFDANKVKIDRLIHALEKAGYTSSIYKEDANITLPEHKDDDCKDKKSEEHKEQKSDKEPKSK